jgi:pimeloyl-ACP methyl ester carboxylesterase
MAKVFLIAGLGADTRLYQNIILPEGYEVVPADWIVPAETDTLTTYAQKLVSHYAIADNSIVIGDSLGGMIAVEIAKQVKLAKVILISSIKTADEAPWYFNFLRYVPIYKPIPGTLFNKLGFLAGPIFGKMSADELGLFNSMLSKSSPFF